LKSHVCCWICSYVSWRSASVTQESASQRGQRSRMAKFPGIPIFPWFKHTLSRPAGACLPGGSAWKS